MSLEILKQLEQELSQLAEFAGTPRIDEDVLFACDSNLRLTVKLDESSQQDSRLLHCHIIAQIGSDTSQNLDACIVGLGESHEQQIKEAAQTWIGLVGAPILSLLNQASVLGAEHFSSNSEFGIQHAHGFVGPRLSRALPDDFSWDSIQQSNLFQNVESFAPPENLQLAKIVLNAEGGRWARHIEINGHDLSYLENDFDLGTKAPEFGTITQFAIFHFAENQHWIEQRQRLDDAICHFVAAFAEEQEIEASLSKMRALGIHEELVHQVHAFSSLAFSRFLFGDLGANYSDRFDRIVQGGEVRQEKLTGHPIYARSHVMSSEFQKGELFDAFQTIALLNSEFNELNEKLNQGLEPKEIVLPNPVIPDFGLDESSITRAAKRILKARG